MITAARWANTPAARRTAGRSTDPVKACATTIAVLSKDVSAAAPASAVHGSYTASIRTPSSVRNVVRSGPGVIKGTEELGNRPSDTELM
ncbi:hypothetical protein GCM10010207_53440 [Streptomyces atratus]|nr:hypothetical protein GCM10010207_53440 [Streptomyces atratus]